MIKLSKGAIPKVLEVNAEKWTRAILDQLATGEKPGKADRARYNHSSIKECLVGETKGKCAYCESYIKHISYGDIEHITPKSVDPTLWFEWTNLTLACDLCNTNKGDKSDLIDPYDDDPENRIIFLGESAWPVPGDEAADLTSRILDLNRDELVGRRRERIEYLVAMLKNIASTKNENLRQMLEQDFEIELQNDREYASMSRRIAREMMAAAR